MVPNRRSAIGQKKKRGLPLSGAKGSRTAPPRRWSGGEGRAGTSCVQSARAKRVCCLQLGRGKGREGRAPQSGSGNPEPKRGEGEGPAEGPERSEPGRYSGRVPVPGKTKKRNATNAAATQRTSRGVNASGGGGRPSRPPKRSEAVSVAASAAAVVAGFPLCPGGAPITAAELWFVQGMLGRRECWRGLIERRCRRPERQRRRRRS